MEATYAEDAPPGGAWVFAAAGCAAPSRAGRGSGRGFELLASAASQGRGPLTLRGVAAGLRLVRDSEQSQRAHGLTMDWSGAVTDGRARGPKDGGMSGAARAATVRLAKVRTVVAPCAYELAWLACVERLPLAAIARATRTAPRNVPVELARALEKLADAYDG